MGQDHVGHRVIGPLVPRRLVDRAELRVIALARPAIGQPLLVRPAAGQVHRNRRVASLGPQLGPLLEGRPAAAMHQHDAGKTLARRASAPNVAGLA